MVHEIRTFISVLSIFLHSFSFNSHTFKRAAGASNPCRSTTNAVQTQREGFAGDSVQVCEGCFCHKTNLEGRDIKGANDIDINPTTATAFLRRLRSVKKAADEEQWKHVKVEMTHGAKASERRLKVRRSGCCRAGAGAGADSACFSGCWL